MSLAQPSVRGGAAARVALGLSILACTLLVIGVRVVLSSRTELIEGRALLAIGNEAAAVRAFRRAGQWYLPGNPYSSEAIAELEQIARAADGADDSERALRSYRAIRAALVSTSGPFDREPERLARTNERIALLTVRLSRGGISVSRSRRDAEHRLRTRLENTHRPDRIYATIAGIGFVVWVSVAFSGARRAFDAEGRFAPARFVRWLAVGIGGFALFCIGLLLA